MRRAGYDVRVLPEEDLGWEENPPTLIEFIRRDQRWCQGTLQYGHFLFAAGHEARQPLPARLRHADVPRLAGLDRAAGASAPLALAAAPTPADFIRPDAGHALLAIILVMWFAPKIATVIDVLTRPKLRRALRRHAALPGQRRDRDRVLHPAARRSCGSATRCSSPACRSAASIGWIGQMRDDHAVPWSQSLHQLWPHTALGFACLGLIGRDPPGGVRLRLPARRRARAVDPARRLHRAARARPRS